MTCPMHWKWRFKRLLMTNHIEFWEPKSIKIKPRDTFCDILEPVSKQWSRKLLWSILKWFSVPWNFGSRPKAEESGGFVPIKENAICNGYISSLQILCCKILWKNSEIHANVIEFSVVYITIKLRMWRHS